MAGIDGSGELVWAADGILCAMNQSGGNGRRSRQVRAFLFLFLILMTVISAEAKTAAKRVAVTVDDLPLGKDLAAMTAVTRSLIRSLTAHKVPAIGFVVESRLRKENEVEQRSALLREWTAAGFDLGNHSNSHLNLNKTGLEAYEQDVLEGEPILKQVLAQEGRTPRYFRSPYLTTGSDVATKRKFAEFLAQHGYAIAPVTIDSRDYFFGSAYGEALEKNDPEKMRQVQHDYLDYVDRLITFSEQSSQEVVGRPIPQILRVHAMQLTVDTADALLDLFQKRGYIFVPLGEALRDPAYRMEERYTGDDPVPWIMRWAEVKGVKVPAEPAMPAYAVRPY